MDNSILDVAFELWRASVVASETAANDADRDNIRIRELKRRFPGRTQEAIEEAYQIEGELEDVAIRFANRDRAAGGKLGWELLAEEFPGFSRESYCDAISYGWLMTR